MPEIDVNASLAPEDRRVTFQNMIYIADGPSDVPAFSIVNHYGGRTLAVYNPRWVINLFRSTVFKKGIAFKELEKRRTSRDR
jgi:hypothetical protein